jgi:transposase
VSGTKRRFTKEFKLQIIEEANAGLQVSDVCRRYEITSGMFYRWKKELEQAKPEKAFPGKGSRDTDKAKMAQLERLIGRQAMEIDFLKNALKRLSGIEK